MQCLSFRFSDTNPSLLPPPPPLPLQEERDETISDFRDTQSTFSVLVATSVAGRGLDVPTCRLVINYSAPNHLEDYVHRVGRTGRAGRNGTAYTLVNDEDEAAYSKIVIKALSDAGWKNNVPAEVREKRLMSFAPKSWGTTRLVANPLRSLLRSSHPAS